MTSSKGLTPAANLIGEKLPNGWTVAQYVAKLPTATGSFFSVGYKVLHESGREAFLKAIDFSEAFTSADPPRELERLTTTFNFERDLLKLCREKNFDRVVRALEDGTITKDGMPVPYLIFEMANGDMRNHMDLAARFDLAWTLRMLHHVTVGLKQLHSVKIAHQDLKPSNVLIFHDLVSKLADLGRSAQRDQEVPHDKNVIAGGLAYAPPELRYGYTAADFSVRRMGADLFLLGNIILFAFTRETMISVLFAFLPPQHMPNNWYGRYYEVLPYVQSAFNDAVNYIQAYLPNEVRGEIVTMLRYLCEPDPSLRGHPLDRGTYSLERFVTKLDVLAYKAERKLF